MRLNRIIAYPVYNFVSMDSSHTDLDRRIRMAAFRQVRHLEAVYNHIPWAKINEGFLFEGSNISLASRPRGIFKPKEMKFLLSIRTVIPRTGRTVWYDDQIDVHEKFFKNIESVEYDFMTGGVDATPNRWLREACEKQIPIIYLLGIAPGLYQAIMPAFVMDWNPIAQKARICFCAPDDRRDEIVEIPSLEERRYAFQTVKKRIHQGQFRESIFAAYKGRCALSGIPERHLLDAAHIISDTNPRLGQPVISNGLLLSKIHHAAFDSHLIGIDPGYRLHVSKRLLNQNDGPMLEVLKQLRGRKLELPKREQDRPDRKRLAKRYEDFKQWDS